MKKRLLWLLPFLALLVQFPLKVSGQFIQLQRIVTGLNQPLYATFAPADFTRLYIVERGGAIRVFNLQTNTLNNANFMNVPDVSFGASDERGLLGLAFHPNFQANKLFYVYHTVTNTNAARIVRFTANNSNSGNPASGLLLLEIPQPQTNHNGGWISFGGDGYLYIATGDGGSANDSGAGHTPNLGNAQDITDNLLGKILRIDVDGDQFPADPNRNYAIPPANPFVGIPGDDEILVYGVRNPWRCSFDRINGDLYIADVGQGAREEITVLPGAGIGGQNLGWRPREGTIATPNVGGPQPAGGINPVYDYPHNGGAFGGASITGGYVYRGPVIGLQGNYFFADFVSSNFWSFQFDGSAPPQFNGNNFTDLIRWNDSLLTDFGTVNRVASFGEDAADNLYVVDYDGEVYRVVNGSNTIDLIDTLVEVRNGALLITGDNNSDQQIIISPTGVPGQYLLSDPLADNTFTTFNGQSSLLVSGVTDDVRLTLKSGAKLVIFSEQDQPTCPLPGDLQITTTGDSSAIIVLDNVDVVGRTDISTRNGNDVIVTMGSTFGDRVQFKTSNGNDVMMDDSAIGLSTFEGDLKFNMGNGDDLIYLIQTVVLLRTDIRSGGQDDSTALRQCLLDLVTVNGNGGFDTFADDDNMLDVLILKSIEAVSSDVAQFEDQLQMHPEYQQALSIIDDLNLQD